MRAIARPWGAMHARLDERDGSVGAVFLNSLGTDLRMWDSAIDELSSLRTALRLDFRGHGLSAVAEQGYYISDLAEDVVAAMDAANIEQAVVIGCSVGGLVAQQLAIVAPNRVSALVLSNTTSRLGTIEAWEDRVQRIKIHGLPHLSGEILERWFAPSSLDKAERDLWRAMLERTPADGYCALCQAIAEADLTNHVSTISVPTCVIAGSMDEATPAWRVSALADRIPQAQFIEFGGVAHLPAIETPVQFAAAVSHFIEGLPNE
ncbi:MAG: 3-oxoadipate enol-lactonase [Cohaesibacteraceae bacterium]